MKKIKILIFILIILIIAIGIALLVVNNKANNNKRVSQKQNTVSKNTKIDPPDKTTVEYQVENVKIDMIETFQTY